MARVYKTKNVQTKPELAGEQNMTQEFIDKNKDKVEDGLMGGLIGLFDKAIERSETQRVRGTNWDVMELAEYIREYFVYCSDKALKPSKSGIHLWLGLDRSTWYTWGKETSKYGAISTIVGHANDIIENQYINRGEQYPTMNVFLLKTSHGHIETSKMDVTSNGQAINSADEVKDLVSKLGLDKQN